MDIITYSMATQYANSLVNNATLSVLRYKGSVNSFEELPTNAELGDVYNIVSEKGKNYAWNGENWDDFGGEFPTKEELGIDQIDNTSDLDKPISTATEKKFEEIENQLIKNIKDSNETSIMQNDNTIISEYSAAFGQNNLIGQKAFYIKSIDTTNKKIYLSKTPVHPPEFSNTDNTDINFETPAYKLNQSFDIIVKYSEKNRSHYHFICNIKEVSNNIITYSGDLPFSAIYDEPTQNFSNTFFVATQPEIGEIDISVGGFAEGENNIAAGKDSHAEGSSTIAAGRYSHTEGVSTGASYAAHAEGYETIAKGLYSHVEGLRTETNGSASHAEGESTQSEGRASHAEGHQTQANGDYSHAEGQATKATGARAHAEGNATIASNLQAHAEGFCTEATAENAHAEGYYAKANGEYSHAEGYHSEAKGFTSHAEGYRSKSTGSYSHAEGANTEASGGQSHAEGGETISSGYQTHSEGYQTQAVGYYTHAEGWGTKASAQTTHAEGQKTSALAEGAHSQGGNTVSLGKFAHIEGRSDVNPINEGMLVANSSNDSIKNTWLRNNFSLAKGIASHVEGTNNLAIGDNSHVEGGRNITTAIGAHAEGSGNQANGKNAHAEGFDVQANGNAAHAEGIGTIADSNGQHAEGKYNIIDDANEYAHIVGNGASSTERSNAYALDWNGNGYYTGEVYVNNNKKLSTEDYVNELVDYKVDKEEGKQLSTNDYTSEEKNKLASLYNYNLPTAGVNLGGVKTGGDVTIENGIININDDSHKHTNYATKEDLSNLVNSAPETLDTLKELAEALGNDTNFSTTVLNKIGNNEAQINELNENKADKTELLQNILDGESIGALQNSSSVANGEYTIALGKENKTGLKGFYIKSIDLINKKIYISAEKPDVEDSAYLATFPFLTGEEADETKAKIDVTIEEVENNIQKLVFKITTPEDIADIKTFGLVFSYDNTIIQPVHKTNYGDITLTPDSTTANKKKPFTTYYNEDDENEFYVAGIQVFEGTNRTGIAIDSYSTVAANAYNGAIFNEFYFRVIDGKSIAKNTFKIETSYGDGTFLNQQYGAIDSAAAVFIGGKYYYGYAKGQARISTTDYTDVNFETPKYDIGNEISMIIRFSETQRSHYHFIAPITAIENNVISYSGDLPFTSIYTDNNYKFANTFFVPAHPEIGSIDMFTGMMAIGEANIAAGENSFVEGYGNIAAGNYGHAGGIGTEAGYAAEAYGQYTKARGVGSWTRGLQSETTAGADYASADGAYCKATARSAKAQGERTEANGLYSNATGWCSIANGQAQSVRGKCNIIDTENKYAEIVGNSNNKNSRSNAYTLDWSGNATFQGEVYVLGAGKNNAEGKKLATEESVNQKLDKINTTNTYPRVYIINTNGAQGTKYIHHNPQTNFIPVWNENGTINLNTDYTNFVDKSAVPKIYVDDKIAELTTIIEELSARITELEAAQGEN